MFQNKKDALEMDWPELGEVFLNKTNFPGEAEKLINKNLITLHWTLKNQYDLNITMNNNLCVIGELLVEQNRLLQKLVDELHED